VVVGELIRERGLDTPTSAALDPPLGPDMRDTCTAE
jgi:hypothetical protein